MHTQEEQDHAKDKYKAQFNKRFDRRYEQYVMDVEGEEGLILSDDDIADEFEALMVGTDLPLPKANSSAFITKIDSISPSDAENMAITLSNNSTSHILLKDQTTDQAIY